MSAPERLCVACGRTVAIPCRFDPVPDCPSPDACTLDMTADEAWQYWRGVAHEQRTAHAAALSAARREALEEARIAARDELMPTNDRSDWTPYAEDMARAAERVDAVIRALAAQPAPTAKGADDA